MPLPVLGVLMVIVALYIVAAEMAKRVFYLRLNQAHTSAPANNSSIQAPQHRRGDGQKGVPPEGTAAKGW
jgi:hypothetical protein